MHLHPATEAKLRERASREGRPEDELVLSAVEARGAAGCHAFLTNDAALRRVRELRIIVLDDSYA